MLNLFLRRAIICSSLFFTCSLFAEEQKVLSGYETQTLKNFMPSISFDGENANFPTGYFDQLRSKINGLGEYKNLVVEIVGHTDNRRLGAASRARWGSNIALSEVRAKNAVKELEGRLDLDNVTFVAKGVGGSEPLVANDTAENQKKNRRGELNVTYEKPVYRIVNKAPVAAPVAVAPAAPVVPSNQNDQAKAALAVTEEDESENTLEEALTAVDQNYSLLKKGKVALQYGHNFTYSSSDSILLSAQTASSGRLPIDVSRDARYTHSSSLSASYGLKNNLTLGVTLPFVSSVRSGSTSQDRAEDDGLGDMSLSLRWQPWPVRLGKANTTLSGGLSLPTGTNPYKLDVENSVATGSGNYSASLGVNFNKSIDPVIVYGGFSLGRGFNITNLNQRRGDRFLRAVRPKTSFSYSMGIGYALSYGVSLNTGFQHTFGSKTVLEFSDLSRAQANSAITSFESIGGHSAIYNVSAGFRTSPGTVLSVNLGIGLTRDSPDFVLGFSLPFSVEGFKKYFSDDQ